MAAERALPPSQLQVLLSAVDAFERSGTSYAAVGAFARNQYAEPRATKDLDFVAASRNPAKLRSALSQAGFDRILLPPLDRPVPGAPAVFRARWTRGFVRLAHRDHPFPIDLFRPDDPFDAGLLKRAKAVPFSGRRIRVTTAEDYIISAKRLIRAFRAIGAPELEPKIGQWTADIGEVRQAMKGGLDERYIRKWEGSLGLGQAPRQRPGGRVREPREPAKTER